MFRTDDNKIVDGGNGRANKTVINSSKNLMPMPNIKATREFTFLISNAKKVFNYLRLAFIKAVILQHFDLESYIWIETDVLGYVMDGVLN